MSAQKLGAADDHLPTIDLLTRLKLVKDRIEQLLSCFADATFDSVDRIVEPDLEECTYEIKAQWEELRRLGEPFTDGPNYRFKGFAISRDSLPYPLRYLFESSVGWHDLPLRSMKDFLHNWPECFDSPEELITRLNVARRCAEQEPVRLDYIPTYCGRWLFKGQIYYVDGPYSETQQSLLVLECFDKERERFERLRQKFTTNDGTDPLRSRPRIPEPVRVEVWRRDNGMCARCGSREKLEYDHIVPISRGGSNTARNIELLCESCNRSKGANIE